MTNLPQKWKPSFPVDKNGKMNGSMIIIGSRRSGKTFILSSLLRTLFMDKYYFVLIFTTNANRVEYQELWDKYKFCHTIAFETNGFNPGVVMKFERMNERMLNNKLKPLNTLIVFDDTAGDGQKFDRDIKRLYTRGRHVNISVIYITQDPTMVSNIWKNNSDVIIMFEQLMANRKEYVIKNFATTFKRYRKPSEEKIEFNQISNEIFREKHKCLVIDYYNRSLSWYKAPVEPKRKIISK